MSIFGKNWEFAPDGTYPDKTNEDEEGYTDRTVCEACCKPSATCKCTPQSLLPPLALAEVVKVLEFGAKKHSPHGWRDNSHGTDIGAFNRHHDTFMANSDIRDPESGLHPLAHAICRLMFMLDRELESKEHTVT